MLPCRTAEAYEGPWCMRANMGRSVTERLSLQDVRSVSRPNAASTAPPLFAARTRTTCPIGRAAASVLISRSGSPRKKKHRALTPRPWKHARRTAMLGGPRARTRGHAARSEAAMADGSIPRRDFLLSAGAGVAATVAATARRRSQGAAACSGGVIAGRPDPEERQRHHHRRALFDRRGDCHRRRQDPRRRPRRGDGCAHRARHARARSQASGASCRA